MTLRTYDPCGVVEATEKPIAPRVEVLDGLKLGVLDNTKWNGNKLLRKTISLLGEDVDFAEVNYYRKENFSMNARPELLAEIASKNDIVLTAIGD